MPRFNVFRIKYVKNTQICIEDQGKNLWRKIKRDLGTQGNIFRRKAVPLDTSLKRKMILVSLQSMCI